MCTYTAWQVIAVLSDWAYDHARGGFYPGIRAKIGLPRSAASNVQRAGNAQSNDYKYYMGLDYNAPVASSSTRGGDQFVTIVDLKPFGDRQVLCRRCEGLTKLRWT